VVETQKKSLRLELIKLPLQSKVKAITPMKVIVEENQRVRAD
jgi:hypothetical protein